MIKLMVTAKLKWYDKLTNFSLLREKYEIAKYHLKYDNVDSTAETQKMKAVRS